MKKQGKHDTYRMKEQKRGGKAWLVITILLSIIILAGAAVACVYMITQNDKDRQAESQAYENNRWRAEQYDKCMAEAAKLYNASSYTTYNMQPRSGVEQRLALEAQEECKNKYGE